MSRAPRVVIVQRYLTHYRRPFFARLARHLEDCEIEVLHGGPLPGDGLPIGTSVPIHEHVHHTFKILPRTGFELVLQPSAALELLTRPPELVILEGTFGVLTNALVLAARHAQGRKSLYWTAGWDDPRLQGWRSSLKNTAISRMVALADGFIVYGSSARAYLEAHGVPEKKIVIAQNTVDVEAIIAAESAWTERARQLRDRMGWTHRRVLGYVGGLAAPKRVTVLLEAYAALCRERDDLALLIVGAGPQLPLLREQICSQKLKHVYLAGHVVEGVEGCFAAMDVFVLPGLGGLALNQAMALGKPVVATIADGTQLDLIEPGENGFIGRVDDPGDLAHWIRAIIAEPDALARMGRRAREILLERATLEQMVRRFGGAVREALAQE